MPASPTPKAPTSEGRVDAYCSEVQYLDHVAPVWEALPPEARGTFYVLDRLAPAAALLGLDVRVGYPPRGPSPCLVASFQDHRAARRTGRPIIYLDHGAGQTYDGDPDYAGHGSYGGGDGHDGTILFLAPSERAADRWRRAYPGVAAVAVGCPKLDRWHPPPAAPAGLTVAFTFHHAAHGWCPEAGSAFRHYEASLGAMVAAVAEQGGVALGHGHPRTWRRGIGNVWRRAGAEPVERLDDVFARAGLLVADNTSAAVEFAALCRPVLWLNAPWFRRSVDHGGRFWEWIEGQVQCDSPDDFAAALDVALADPPEAAQGRGRMVRDVYSAVDGCAALRAAEAVLVAIHTTAHIAALPSRSRSEQDGT